MLELHRELGMDYFSTISKPSKDLNPSQNGSCVIVALGGDRGQAAASAVLVCLQLPLRHPRSNGIELNWVAFFFSRLRTEMPISSPKTANLPRC